MCICWWMNCVNTRMHGATIKNILYVFRVGRVAQSVLRLATAWTVRGSNPGGGEIFRTCPDRPWGPPSLLYNGYRVFSRCKERPGRDAERSPPSSAVVMEGRAIPLLPLRAVRPVQSLSACTRVTFTFTFTFYHFTYMFGTNNCSLSSFC